MTAEERKAFTQEQLAGAVKAVESEGFPTGIRVTIGGKEYIARPARQTGSGGVTYSISARPTSLGKYSARFNKFSFTLMGEGMATVADSFEKEDLA
jgi:hypothetical protein